tara:strand:- start:212 stop:754 length:543 start_codon:yes stop_codon:yes gene_type:complete
VLDVAGASTEVVSVIESHESTGTESSFTFSDIDLSMDNDSHLILEIDLACTAGLLLQLQYNDMDVSYYAEGHRIVGGTQTIIDQSNQSAFDLTDSTILVNANDSVGVLVELTLTKGATGVSRNIQMFSKMHGIQQEAIVISGANANANITQIADVKILTSTSTWTTGSRMTLYRVRRAPA